MWSSCGQSAKVRGSSAGEMVVTARRWKLRNWSDSLGCGRGVKAYMLLLTSKISWSASSSMAASKALTTPGCCSSAVIQCAAAARLLCARACAASSSDCCELASALLTPPSSAAAAVGINAHEAQPNLLLPPPPLPLVAAAGGGGTPTPRPAAARPWWPCLCRCCRVEALLNGRPARMSPVVRITWPCGKRLSSTSTTVKKKTDAGRVQWTDCLTVLHWQRWLPPAPPHVG